jgi:hypothetical protein
MLLFFAVISLCLSVFSAYFAYRWIRTLYIVDKDTRVLLIGETIEENMDRFGLWLIGTIMLSFSFLTTLLTAAHWNKKLRLDVLAHHTIKG